MRPHEQSRHLGPAVVSGALRGALAGTAIALAIAVYFATQGRAVVWEDVAVILLVPALLVPVTLAVGEELSELIANERRAAIVRFVAGFLAPFVAIAPRFSLVQQSRFIGSWGETVFGLVVFGFALGAGQAATFKASDGRWTSRRERALARASMSALVVGIGGFFLFGYVESSLVRALQSLIVCFLGALFAFAFFHGILAVADAVTAPLANRIAAWLEPERLALQSDDDLAARHREECQAFADARSEPRLLERALDHARAALVLSESSPSLAAHVGSDRRHVLETLLRMGDGPAAAKFAKGPLEPEILRAEMARAQGDLQRALGEANAALAGAGGAESSRSRAARANAHAVLALTFADLGQPEEAARHLEATRSVTGYFGRAFDHLEPGAVEAHLRHRAVPSDAR